MLDLLHIENFLDGATVAKLLAELREADAAPATVYGSESGAVNVRMRRTTRMTVPDSTRDAIAKRLLDDKQLFEKHFGLELRECEEPQFLRYRTGDFFVAHQDGNTPLLRLERGRDRAVSIVLFLSDAASYEGGALVFTGSYEERYRRVAAEAAAGTLVAFRSETTHEVTPVTQGERFTIASWLR